MKISVILARQEIFHQLKSILKRVLSQQYLLDMLSRAMKLSRDTLDQFKVRTKKFA